MRRGRTAGARDGSLCLWRVNPDVQRHTLRHVSSHVGATERPYYVSKPVHKLDKLPYSANKVRAVHCNRTMSVSGPSTRLSTSRSSAREPDAGSALGGAGWRACVFAPDVDYLAKDVRGLLVNSSTSGGADADHEPHAPSRSLCKLSRGPKSYRTSLLSLAIVASRCILTSLLSFGETSSLL